jgi:uncharacterized membrane protein
MANPVFHPSSQPGAHVTERHSGPWPRYLTILLSVWLFISAFAWMHTAPSRTNTWIVAVLLVLSALSTITAPAMRWFNMALSVWLFISTLAFPHVTNATLWNNLIVAVVVFVLSLIPRQMQRHSPSHVH